MLSYFSLYVIMVPQKNCTHPFFVRDFFLSLARITWFATPLFKMTQSAPWQ